jgi:UDP-N-acetylglucosamine--N-acetylmuramyl-(pentapeptide) pyrophosphoryl-undecaprenol N-acetylglucosamine transferase
MMENSAGGTGITLFVATTGGHLTQLHELADRINIKCANRLWITFDSPQSRSLLKGENRYFIPAIHERDILGVLRGGRIFHRLQKQFDVKAVISTGSAIALSFLPYAALRGIDAYYIESVARVGAPSLTGRILARIPNIKLYRPYEHAATGRWRYGGSVFDAYLAEKLETVEQVTAGLNADWGSGRSTECVDSRPLRVVVTIGTIKYSFRRLFENLVKILPDDAEVLWQTGHTPVDGLGIDGKPFIPAADLDTAMRAADVVIAHSGCGSALDALRAGRMPILVPRDPRLGEIVDGHQVEVATWLANRGLALHRTPESVTLEDLRSAASRRITRVKTPPKFVLETPA